MSDRNAYNKSFFNRALQSLLSHLSPLSELYKVCTILIAIYQPVYQSSFTSVGPCFTTA